MEEACQVRNQLFSGVKTVDFGLGDRCIPPTSAQWGPEYDDLDEGTDGEYVPLSSKVSTIGCVIASMELCSLDRAGSVISLSRRRF